MKPSFNKYKQNKLSNKTTKERKRSAESKSYQKAEISSESLDLKNVQNQDNSQIISGYFLNEKPYKEMIIQRVNTFLYVILGLLVAFCLVCYYFVSCSEVELNKISRETLELNYENEELQNKVDSLQSYYNIDKAISKTNILERAKHVVEVDAINLPNLNFNNKSKGKHSMVVKY